MVLRTASALALVAATGTMATAAADPDTCNPVDGAPNSCAGQPMEMWPLAQGNFTSPGDPGWVYFKPFFHPAGSTGPKADASRAEQYGCGIGPDGTVGCDHVPPDPWQGNSPGCGDLHCPPPPPGTNQTVAGPQQPGQYVQSPVATFTRNVVLDGRADQTRQRDPPQTAVDAGSAGLRRRHGHRRSPPLRGGLPVAIPSARQPNGVN